MSQKNVIFVCCIAEPWIDVIEELSKSGLNAKYLVHWRDEKEFYLNSGIKDCYFHSVEDAWSGKGFPGNYAPIPLDEEQLKSIAWYESQALIMMGRLDPTEVRMTTATRQYFFRDLVGYWLTVILEKDI